MKDSSSDAVQILLSDTRNLASSIFRPNEWHWHWPFESVSAHNNGRNHHTTFGVVQDNDLCGAPTLGNTRRKKAGEKLREKGLAFLDESLEHKKKRWVYNKHIVKIKQEQSECDEERLT